MDNRSIHVCLVIHQTLLRECLMEALSREPRFRLTACATAAAALSGCKLDPAGVLVVDIDGPGAPSAAFVRQARSGGAQTGIVALASGAGYPVLRQWLQNGGVSIFLKQDSSQLLIHSIFQAAEAPGDPVSLVALRRRISGAEAAPPLTARESLVLGAVSRGLSNKQIAENLNLTQPLVKAAIRQLFRKTGAKSRAQLTRLGMERYYLL